MRLKWSKGHGFLRVEWWSKIQLSDQYAPAREERQFFIISYNRKKQNERQNRRDTRARSDCHKIIVSLRLVAVFHNFV